MGKIYNEEKVEGAVVKKVYIQGKCYQIPLDKEVEVDRLVDDIIIDSQIKDRNANVGLKVENMKITEER